MPASPPRGIPCAPTLAALGQSTRLFKLLLRGETGGYRQEPSRSKSAARRTLIRSHQHGPVPGLARRALLHPYPSRKHRRYARIGFLMTDWCNGHPELRGFAKAEPQGALMLASNYEASQVSRSHATISGPAEEFASQDIACGPSSQFHLQHAGAQHASTVLLLVGFTARTKALMNLPSTCGARASTSTPFPDRNSLASSIA